MTSGIEREACWRCAELVPSAATACHHCDASLLVDVRPSRPSDPRTAYAAAKALNDALPGTDFGRLREGLTTPDGPPVVGGVTRAVARAAVVTLAEAGITATAVRAPDAPVHSPSKSKPGAALLAVAILIPTFIIGAGVAYWVGVRDARGDEPAASAAQQGLSAQEVAAFGIPATVSIQCGTQVGSGFFVTAETLLTNAHVLCPGAITVFTDDGRSFPAQVLLRDDTLDFAHLRVRGAAATPLRLGDATGLVSGQEVFSIGAPAGLSSTVTRGIVAHPNRALRGVSYVQLDQAINHGNSGGPVIDANGRVVGIVTLRHELSDGVGFALPINYTFGPVPASAPGDWDRTAWHQRIAGMAPSGGAGAGPTFDGQGLGAQPGVGDRFAGFDMPLLLAAGPATQVRISGWDLGQTPADDYALVVIATRTAPPGLLRFEIHGGGSRYCGLRGDTAWRSLVAVDDPRLVSLREELRRSGVDPSQLFVGFAALRPERGCTPWRGQAQLRLIGGAPGYDSLAVRR